MRSIPAARTPLLLLGTAASLLFCSTLAAHTVWLQPDTAPGVYRVYFGGHAGKLEDYPADKLKSVQAYAADSSTIAIERKDAADGVRLIPARPPVLIAMHYDNGVWSRSPQGRSVNQTLDRTPGATHAVKAVKYHKTILQWTPFVARPLGQKFEVTPVVARAPRAGQAMQLRVTLDGKPVAGIGIGRGEEGKESVTDASGMASFVPEAGFNKVWAGQRSKVTGEPQYTEFSYEYLLGFHAEAMR